MDRTFTSWTLFLVLNTACLSMAQTEYQTTTSWPEYDSITTDYTSSTDSFYDSTTQVPNYETTQAPNNNQTSTAQPTNSVGDGNSSSSSGSSSSTSEFLSTTEIPAATVNPVLANCSTKSSLEKYCNASLTSLERNYFKENSSLVDILSKIILPAIVDELKEKCVPGNWCLADSFDERLSQSMMRYYDGPVCRTDTVWNCLKYMWIARNRCDRSEMYFVMSVVGLLCDMEVIEYGRMSTACYTGTVKALHVLYSDMTREIKDVNSTDQCKDYNKQMVDTYECGRLSCDLEQQVFLKGFGPWAFITHKSMQIAEECGLTLTCPVPQEKEQSQAKTSDASNSDKDSDSIQALKNQLDEQEATERIKLNNKINEINAIKAEEAMADKILQNMLGGDGYYDDSTTNPGGFGQGNLRNQGMPELTSLDGDRAFIYGMVTVSLVVLVGITLVGLMAFKKMRNKHYKLGYSRMTEEESRMLKSEYN